MVKHVVRRSQGVPDSNIMHPTREWIVGVGSVALAVIVGVVLDVATFHNYKTSFTTEVTVIETAVPYQAALVSTALYMYKSERETYEHIRGVSLDPSHVVTPRVTTDTRATSAATSSLPDRATSTTPIENTPTTHATTTTAVKAVKEVPALPSVTEKPISPQSVN